jgi:hypothetical protein
MRVNVSGLYCCDQTAQYVGWITTDLTPLQQYFSDEFIFKYLCFCASATSSWLFFNMELLDSLSPATTSDVEMKESIAVLNRGLNSESALEAMRHKQVALPSIAAPYSTGTCRSKQSIIV